MPELSAPASSAAANGDDLRIEVVTRLEDFPALFDCCAATFGRQTNDAIWTGMNPGWDTPEGRTRGAARMADRWRLSTRNHNGDVNTVFLKATVLDPADEHRRRVAGIAIWAQLSMVNGHGETPQEDEALRKGIETLYPGNDTEQRFMHQMMKSLMRRRLEVVKEKTTAELPGIMVLDLCAVDPAFQRKGIASKLVKWGLDEAKRRGGYEATTEASSMGRFVYTQLGFRPESPEADILSAVDSEFELRSTPPNVLLRTLNTS